MLSSLPPHRVPRRAPFSVSTLRCYKSAVSLLSSPMARLAVTKAQTPPSQGFWLELGFGKL